MATGLIGASIGFQPIPLLGGTVWIDPQSFVFVLVNADSLGEAQISFQTPPPLIGVTMVLQAALTNQSQSGGLDMSHALQVVL